MTSQRHPSKCSSTGALSERPGALRCESRHENSRWASRPSGTRRRASSRRPPCRSRHSRRRRSIKSRGKENVVAHVVKYATTDTTCSLPRGGSRRAAAPRAPARALRAASFVRPRNVRRDARAGLPRRAPPGGVIAEASLGCCCCCCGSGRDAARGRGPALALGRGRVAVRDVGVQVACKSLVIGLALLDRVIDAAKAETAARLEEQVQIDRWGFVEGSHDYDVTRIRFRLASASLFADYCA
mmetsp:Transcript_9746/g.39666  ORF Transcript_9746/g.39666 Transcript_9746/m.39666 type:complete len:242 (-) Transcript_9746:1243-1968(-)